jgi:molybdopterin synthase sulfur carrier subunit
MKIDVRYFASIREALGAGETLEVPDGATLGQIREQLIARGGAHAATLARDRALRVALDQSLSDEAVQATDGAEVAFFPPVTGG